MSLLSRIRIESFHDTQLSGYLGYVMATMGSMVDMTTNVSTHSLWSYATSLITVGLEMDNCEARKTDLINAATLLCRPSPVSLIDPDRITVDASGHIWRPGCRSNHLEADQCRSWLCQYSRYPPMTPCRFFLTCHNRPHEDCVSNTTIAL